MKAEHFISLQLSFETSPSGTLCHWWRCSFSNTQFIVNHRKFCPLRRLSPKILAQQKALERAKLFTGYYWYGENVFDVNMKENNAHQGLQKRCQVIRLQVFLVCWTPYALLCIFAVFFDVSSLPLALTKIPAISAKMATILNPIVYISIDKVRSAIAFNRDSDKKEN